MRQGWLKWAVCIIAIFLGCWWGLSVYGERVMENKKSSLEFYTEYKLPEPMPPNIGDAAIMLGQDEYGLVSLVYVYEFKKECEEGKHSIRVGVKEGCWVLQEVEKITYYKNK